MSAFHPWRPRREVDLIRLLWAAAKARGLDPAQADLYWDLGAEAYHSHLLRHENCGKLMCFLTGHRHFSSRRRRIVTGAEQLVMQGYPCNLDWFCGGEAGAGGRGAVGR
eukprot:5335164-Prorocentrum_lima.AAC.1